MPDMTPDQMQQRIKQLEAENDRLRSKAGETGFSNSLVSDVPRDAGQPKEEQPEKLKKPNKQE